MTEAASPFVPGQIVTVFRSRLRPDVGPDYHETSDEMEGLGRSMPGFVDVKFFTADDGERLALTTFADEESQRAWRELPAHREAQRRGYERWYAEFTLQVCETVRVTTFRG